MKISVVIATRNRYQDILSCLKHISKQSVPFHCIVVDQSDQKIDSRTIKKMSKMFAEFDYLYLDKIGKSNALNYGLRKVTTKYVAFTDDDCFPDLQWLETFLKLFEKNKKISAVFGMTVPYFEGKSAYKSHCPSTFIPSKDEMTIMEPTSHWDIIGLGNNCAYKTDVVRSNGGFNTLLGPGTIARAAEDADLILKTLVSGYTILSSKLPIVQHNKWLNDSAFKKLSRDYFLGQIACYGAYALKGKIFAARIILKDIIFLLHFKNLLKKYPVKEIVLYYVLFLKGIFIATIIIFFYKPCEKDGYVIYS